VTGGFLHPKVTGINSFPQRCPYFPSNRNTIDSKNRQKHTFPMTDSPMWYRNWYRFSMSMNLRLPETLATGLKQLSQETGKSQQLLAREAVEVYLRDYRLQAYPPEIRHAITPATKDLSEILDQLPPALPWTGEKSIIETIREMREDRTS